MPHTTQQTTFPGPNTFKGYMDWLEKESERTGKELYYTEYKLAHNTTVRLKDGSGEWIDDVIVIRLHHTDILEFEENGNVRMTAGYWQTPTTMRRLNQFGPEHWKVWQEDKKWWVGIKGKDFKIPFNAIDSISVPFAIWEQGKTGLDI